MKRLLVLALAAALTPVAAAKVWTSVYRHDGVTPLEAADPNLPNIYRDVMAGTRLTLVVSSDSGAYFWGHLRLSWNDAQYGRLAGRGYTATLPGSSAYVPNYKGSCLDAAGTRARARDYMAPEGIGFEFNTNYTLYITGGHPAVAGDWFIFDYYAERVGACTVGLYDLFASPDIPIQTLSFTHVPSWDFNNDTVVDLKDFALFAVHWRSAIDPNSGPGAVSDLEADGRADLAGLAAFSDYWLARTGDSAAPAEPNGIAKP
jgi:hypothetical protein